MQKIPKEKGPRSQICRTGRYISRRQTDRMGWSMMSLINAATTNGGSSMPITIMCKSHFLDCMGVGDNERVNMLTSIDLGRPRYMEGAEGLCFCLYFLKHDGPNYQVFQTIFAATLGMSQRTFLDWLQPTTSKGNHGIDSNTTIHLYYI